MKISIKNAAKLSLILIATIVIVTTSYLASVLWRSQPVMSGEIKISALKDNVTIIRDNEGIPHIYSKYKTDMYFGLGFVMASDRLFQYDLLRRVGSGTTAEILGPKMLPVDKLFRTIAAKKTFENKISKLPPEVINEYKAFSDGLNYYVENYPLPIEFTILNYRPSKFSIEDAYYIYAFLAYSFSPMIKEDYLNSEIKKYIKDRDLSQLVSVKGRNLIGLTPNTGDSKSTTIGQDLFDVDNLLKGFSTLEGSNAWVIDSTKSKSGSPILASDPHINYSLPNMWYEAHLSSEEDNYEMYSHFLPLIPYPALGHNQNIGWGLTMSYIDDLDLIKVEVDNDHYYEAEKRVKLKKTKEIIKVKGESDHIMYMNWTKAGPIGDEIFKQRNISLNWAFHHKDNFPILSFYKLAQAKNLEQVKEASALGKAPGLNILYADKEGNIAHVIYGSLLKRKNLLSSYTIGDDINNITGEYDFDQKPNRINPKSGYLVSANDRHETNLKDLRGNWYPKNRHDTIVKLLEKKEKLDINDMKEIQVSNLDNFASTYKDIMVRALSNKSLDATEEAALKFLKSWNGHSEVHSIGATIFHHFNYLFFPFVLDELKEQHRYEYCHTTASWYFHQRLMQNPNNKWWDKASTKKIETQDSAILELFKMTVKDLKEELGDNVATWKWAKLHTLEFAHPFSKNKFLAPLFNLGPYPISGAMNVINHNRRKGCQDLHKVKSGPSTRRIIDFANPKVSYGILPLGNSAHPLSPFYDNQVQRFIKGQYRKQLLDKSDILENQSFKLILRSN